ncbi:hypothetical protein QFC20_001325 [Naganishia adeliensis]|uniref:Uncharacterized protein n=1 Tax=Naganishia adeliensis TaxID=92952 RepID=A0ACC2WUH6_9TREE|nr:hypothetical protein QFC20_001325 [Naganishia adeliensis]
MTTASSFGKGRTRLAILEWTHGEISTVSLHTFERAPQVLYANPEDFVSILRTDPGNKLIVNLLPNDALAMIPLVQDIEEFEGFDSSSVRDVPYMPSFILSLPELSPLLRNIKDLSFLPGFNNPTLAILFQPLPTATGRTSTPHDTFHLEIRTLDPLAQTYPLISSVPNLPSDSQYLVPCPQSVGGVLLVTATALIHVDQSGKFVTTSTNGWFRFTSAITATLKREECRLELDGSRVVWADEGNFLVLLRDGGVVQARLQVEGRSVVGIDLVAPKGASEAGEGVVLDLGLNQPSAVCEVPHTAPDGSVQNAVFAASAVGDSHLVSITMVPEETTAAETTAKDEMDVDLDDDLYGDSVIRSELTMAERQLMQAHLAVVGKVAGVGYISDMTFGVTPEDPVAREQVTGVLPIPREPELAVLQGCGRAASTVNLLRSRLQLQRKRNYEELVGSSEVRAISVDIPADEAGQPAETVNRLLQVPSNEEAEGQDSTYLWAVDSSTGELQEVLMTFEGSTIAAGRCINGSYIARVGEKSVSVIDSDGTTISEYQLEKTADTEDESDSVVDADISDPTIVLRRKSGKVVLLHLASEGACVRFESEEVPTQPTRPWTSCQLVGSLLNPFTSIPAHGKQPESSSRQQQWLVLANKGGDLEIRSVPGLTVAFRSNGLGNADQILIDDGVENMSTQMDTSDGTTGKEEKDEDEDLIQIEQICLTSVGEGACLTGSHPHFLHEDDVDGLVCTTWPEPINALANIELDEQHQLLMITSEAALLKMQPLAANDTPKICRKRLERTYTHLNYDARSSYYVGASAIAVPYQLYSDECELIPGPEAPNLTPALIERSTIELLDPYTWTAIDGYEFDENEAVLCMENMILEATSTEAGVKKYLVVGTSVNRGEDMSSKGNTYVFEIIEVIGAAPGVGDWRLRLICTEEARGPISAIANIGQYLVQAMGQKIYVKALDKEDRLVPVAFLDVPPYITSLRTFKNLLLIGDMVKSVWLAVFQESPFKLDVIAKDLYDASIVSIDFLSSEGAITFGAVDDRGDLRLLEFDSQQSSSNEVAKLVRRTEYHMGPSPVKTDSMGGLSTLVPLKAARFKRLQLLQGQLTRSVQHVAGLNPKAYRHVANRYQARALNKGVLDGFLLQTFIDLPIDKQKDMVSPIGTNRETIINDLMDLAFAW